jgi:hypothetical protein
LGRVSERMGVGNGREICSLLNFFHFVIFKNLVNDCQECIKLIKWFQMHIKVSRRDSLERLKADVILGSMQCDLERKIME